MKVETRKALENLFTNDLGRYINREEIDNAILMMDNGFDDGVSIDKDKLMKAISLAEGYLLSISITNCIANICLMYKQRVEIVLAKAAAAILD